MATTVDYRCTASDSFKPIKFLQSDWLYEVFTRDRFYPRCTRPFYRGYLSSLIDKGLHINCVRLVRRLIYNIGSLPPLCNIH